MLFFKRVFLLLSLVFGIALHTKAQTIVLEGTIVDAGTKETLKYASVGIVSKGLGTSTNENGYYKLKVPVTCQQDTLTVSCIGYKTQLIPVKSIKNNTQIKLFLEKDIQDLPEITLRNETGISIMKKVIEKLPQNYELTEDYSYRLFCSGIVTYDAQHPYLLEAVFDIIPKKHPKDCPLRIKKIRAKAYDEQGETFMQEARGISLHGIVYYIMKHNRNDYLKKNKINRFALEIEDEYVWGKDTIVVITAKYKKNKEEIIQDTLHINKTDYAVVSHNTHTVVVGENLEYYSYKIYEKYQNKYHLKRVIASSKYPTRKGLVYSKRHFFITNIQYGVSDFPEEEKLGNYTQKIAYKIEDFNDDFWEDYNVIERPTTPKEAPQNNQKATYNDTLKKQKHISFKNLIKGDILTTKEIKEEGKFKIILPENPTKTSDVKQISANEHISVTDYSASWESDDEEAIDFYANFSYIDLPTSYDKAKIESHKIGILENIQNSPIFKLKLLDKNENGKFKQHDAMVCTLADEENGLYAKYYFVIKNHRIYIISLAKGDSMPTEIELKNYIKYINIFN